MAAVAGSGDGAEIVPSSWRSRKVYRRLPLAPRRAVSEAVSPYGAGPPLQDPRYGFCRTTQADGGESAEVKSLVQTFSQFIHKGESTTVMEYVLLFIARPAETSSRQSHHADLLIAGRINNSLFGALARAEGTVCCGVQIVVKIMRLSKVCLKLKDGNNCTNPAHYTANTADDSSRRGRDGEESRPLTDIFSLSFCSRLGCSSVYLMDPV